MARAERQRQGKLLRDSFSDVDRVPLEWFKGGLVDAPFDLVLLLAHRSINQREAVRNAARYRVESDRASLHELGLECRLQQNDFAVLATKLDDGRQVTPDLVRQVLDEETAKIYEQVGDEIWEAGRPRETREVFEKVALSPDLIEFMTIPAYRLLD